MVSAINSISLVLGMYAGLPVTAMRQPPQARLRCRDNTAAGAGNIFWSFDVLAVAYNTPFTVDLQTPFSVGLFLDFTGTTI